MQLLRFVTLLITFSIAGVHAESTKILRLAITTSTENSGLLEYLMPKFEAHSGYETQVIAVGTGAALRVGREGDVDALLVHAPKAEKELVEAGYSVRRVSVMVNDFIFVGPQGLPADNLTSAMVDILRSEKSFVSRGNDSGTHKKELGLWALVGLAPRGDWYHESGQGMAKVLQIANELDTFTLVDRRSMAGAARSINA